MSAYVLIEFINRVEERDKMRGLPSISSLFRNEFNKFNNTRAQNVRLYLSYDIKITLKSHFWRKTYYVRNICYRRYFIHLTLSENL